jgi:hypothetical protein
MYLYIDTKTLPTADPKIIQKVFDDIEAPSNWKDPDKIAAYKTETSADAIVKTALDGAYGRLCAISCAVNDDKPWLFTAACRDEERDLEVFHEGLLLSAFFDDVTEVAGSQPVTVVGHNVRNFHFKFITQRAVVHGVRLPMWWPTPGVRRVPWKIFDTMTAWSGSKGCYSLDALCTVLGIPGKRAIDGSEVAELWSAGRYQDVAQYCGDDVVRARNLAKRMWAAIGEPMPPYSVGRSEAGSMASSLPSCVR